MKKLLIIPARSGSKRIPNKNFKNFLGKPLIAYTIEKALKSDFFDEIMVSTDSAENATLVKKVGAEVPFLRSKKNSEDASTTASVIVEVINEYKKRDKFFDFVCCIYPTSVLLSMNKVKEGFFKLIDENRDSVLSVLKYSHPVERALVEINGSVNFVYPEHMNTRTQQLGTKYFDAGQFYWFKSQKFQENQKVITNNSSFVLLEEFDSQDIDEPYQWNVAEMKYRFQEYNSRKITG